MPSLPATSAALPPPPAAAGIPRYRPFSGPPLFGEGFRPFFLAAGLWAPAAMALWVGHLAGWIELPTAFGPLNWHVHEMLFGFAAAAVAGFLLTAIPNWTGRMPLQGVPLIVLASLWLAGRIACALSLWTGPAAAAIADLAFLAVLLLAIGREILAGRNWRNLPMVGALSLLLAANLLFHLEALEIAPTADIGRRLGVAMLLLMISLIGGRIIPSFTRNWLAKQEAAELPAAFGIPDRVALAATALALASWVVGVPGIISGPLLIAAGIAAAIRLARWRGLATVKEPLLVVLHLGHGWLAIGLVLLGASELTDLVPASAALHALTAGAIGTMILGVMTRATLGHTGHALTAGAGTTAIYTFITLATLARLAVWWLPVRYDLLLQLAGLAWIAAFLLFLAIYGPMLLGPRQSKAG
jgi:uncharacterized protein involved in response to NO